MVNRAYFIKLTAVYFIMIIGMIFCDLFFMILSQILGMIIAYREFEEDNNYLIKSIFWMIFLFKGENK